MMRIRPTIHEEDELLQGSTLQGHLEGGVKQNQVSFMSTDKQMIGPESNWPYQL